MSYQENVSELTKCALCLEILCKPKYLQCLHTFCENCVAIFIENSFFKNRIKSKIDCPVCLAECFSPTKECTAKEWAQQLPVNALVVGLLDKMKIERAEKQCMSCQRQGKTSQALFLCMECSDAFCENCNSCHSGNRFTSTHKTMSIKNLPEAEKTMNYYHELCSIHKDQELKLFCVDHDVPCCPLCVSVSHRKCNTIRTIEQAAEDVLTSGCGEIIEKTLQDITKNTHNIIAHNKKCKEQLEADFNNVDQMLDAYYQELVTKIECFKQRQKQRLKTLLNEKKITIEMNTNRLENLLKRTENEAGILNVSMKEASAIQVLLEIRKLKEKESEHKGTILQVFKNTGDFRLFFKSQQDADAIINLLEVDNILECEEKSCSLGLVGVPVIKLRSRAKLEDAIKDCCYEDNKAVFLLKDGTFRVYDITGESPTMNISNRIYPYLRDSVAITRGNEREFGVLSRLPKYECTNKKKGRMEKYECVFFFYYQGNYCSQTRLDYENASCIAFEREKQALIIGSSNTIYVSDRSGRLLTSFFAKDPTLITTDANARLYYAEYDHIICRNLEGTILNRIKTRNCKPIRGLAVDNKDNIYFTSCFSDSIDATSINSGTSYEILGRKDGLSMPTFLHVNHDGKTFLVINNRETLLFDIL